MFQVWVTTEYPRTCIFVARYMTAILLSHLCSHDVNLNQEYRNSRTTNKSLFLEDLKQRLGPLPVHNINTNIKIEAEVNHLTNSVMES